MNRKLSPEVIKKRKRKFILKLAFIGIATIMVMIFLVNILRSGISYDSIYTSEVDKGTLEISVSATGKVVPLSEEVIVSPVATRILEVYKKAGEQLEEGEVIIKLDLETVNADVEKQKDELAMKRYQLDQQRRASESQLADLEMQIEIDEMKIRRMEILLRNEVFLDSIGAGTSDKIKQAELEYEVEKLKLKQLKLKYINQKQNAEADRKVMELDYNIALKNSDLKNKMMSDAQIRSPRTNILKWVNDQVGVRVPEGAELAIVSDLSHFKIDADISDSYGDKILSGNKVIVKTGNQELTGVVGNVVPSVKDGMINFTVLLDNNEHESLRPGLKVEVYVINAIQEEALRIANRSYYKGPGEYDLWVIQGQEAIKRQVELGESNYRYVEVKEGLNAGEIVIISDMSALKEKNKLKVRK
ncbi:MAG: HlyD family efflux transporter periplasmic adaptor subunit [Candidatus Azobacteroides sp.]|nr:HlyD family efflux transporter periplasmic adaptor subunit [Candidatus Azobacteroides sp.]